MDLRLHAIREPGDLDRERVVLKAETDTDTGRHLLLSARSSNDRLLGGHVPNCYWFPDRHISAGDWVVLYSKRGSVKVRDNKSGSKSYFFYWGLDQPLWQDHELRPVLIRVGAWRAFAPEDVEEDTAEHV